MARKAQEFDGDQVELVGSVEKVETFASKGGGLTIKLQTGGDEDGSVAAGLITNLQRRAQVRFQFTSQMPDPPEGDERAQLALDV
jgi:hypothetical protein